MGSYVSATVLGGLSGRLLGGFIHPPLHWRYAFFSAAALILAATLVAVVVLPRTKSVGSPANQSKSGLLSLLKRRDLVLIYSCGAGALLIFSPVFNFLPYRMEGAPFHFSTELTTLIYLVYVLGIFLGPLAGRFSNRFGAGRTLILATIIEAAALLLLLIPWVAAVIVGLLGVCAGFFTIHAVAVGLLNRKLSRNHGKANAIYMLFYYTGGWLGITGAGFAFERFSWQGVVFFVMCFLVIPLITGLSEKKAVGHG
ncbi:conserved hypothetical protein [delta proteobacterium NaphS2]|nr:conserved hypothetical protein [delta proteobacterium NaphS2]